MIIPREWRDFLRDIQSMFPQAVIAGGCLRDLQNGRPFKDVDIFIPDITDEEQLKPLHLKFGTKKYDDNGKEIKVKRDVRATYGNLGNGDIQGIITLDNGFEIISCKRAKETILDHFDFGICQIMYDGYTITRTEAFKTDVKNKTFTIIRCEDREQYRRSHDRFLRLKGEKYQDFTLDKGRFSHYR